VDEKHTRARTMKLGLTWHEADANVDRGFVLYSSIYPEDPDHNYVRVLDMYGNQVHQWDMGTKKPGLWSYMPELSCLSRYRKPNQQGFLFAITKLPRDKVKGDHEFTAWASDRGGLMELIDFDGHVLWSYSDEYQHHDARLTKGGNIAYLANEVLDDKNEAGKIVSIAASHRGFPHGPRNPKVYSDVIKIVDPITKVVLFEWHAADHLDPEIDVLNFNDPFDEWNHGNTIVPIYEDADRPTEVTHLLVSFRQISTVVKINIADGSFERLLRSPFVSQQHDCTSLAEDNTDRILVFDNRYVPNDFAPSAFSRVVEYDMTQKAPCPLFPQVSGPKVRWVYVDGVCDFYSAYISGAQRLPRFTLEDHGVQYTLITEGMKGRMFIVKTEVGEKDGKRILRNKIIWEYLNPEIAPGENKDVILGRSSIFRARYISSELFTTEQINKISNLSNLPAKL